MLNETQCSDDTWCPTTLIKPFFLLLIRQSDSWYWLYLAHVPTVTKLHGSQYPGSRTRPVSLVPCDLGSGSPALEPSLTADHFLHILLILNALCSWVYEDYDIPTKNMKQKVQIKSRRMYFSPLIPGGPLIPGSPGCPGGPGGPVHPPFSRTAFAIRMMLTNIRRSWLKKQRERFFLFFCFLFCFIYIWRVDR